jgi:hypothetical protein
MCQAVVRLRPEKAAVAGPAGPPPLPGSPPLPPAPQAEEEFSVDLLPGPVKGDIPAVFADLTRDSNHEAPASRGDSSDYRDAPRGRALLAWCLFGLMALVVIGAVTTAAILWG